MLPEGEENAAREALPSNPTAGTPYKTEKQTNLRQQPLAWEQAFLAGLVKLSVSDLKSIYLAVSSLKHNKLHHMFSDIEAELKKDETNQAGRIFNIFQQEYQQVMGLINQSLGGSFFPELDNQIQEIALAFQHPDSAESIKNRLTPLKRVLKKSLSRVFNYLEGMQHNLNSLAQAGPGDQSRHVTKPRDTDQAGFRARGEYP